MRPGRLRTRHALLGGACCCRLYPAASPLDSMHDISLFALLSATALLDRQTRRRAPPAAMPAAAVALTLRCANRACTVPINVTDTSAGRRIPGRVPSGSGRGTLGSSVVLVVSLNIDFPPVSLPSLLQQRRLLLPCWLSHADPVSRRQLVWGRVGYVHALPFWEVSHQT